MFVQFIEGRVADPQAWRRQLDRWHQEHAGQAPGWLGTTAGLTDDGVGFAAARFSSAEQARANSERPEQSAWWSETERTLDGPASFEDCDNVEQLRGGGSDDAGFVQVIRGTVNDVAAARELFLEEMSDDARPDVVGGLVGMASDGAYTMVVYFTAEAAARAGEAEDPDEEFQRRMMALHDTPPRYLDLREPMLWSG